MLATIPLVKIPVKTNMTMLKYLSGFSTILLVLLGVTSYQSCTRESVPVNEASFAISSPLEGQLVHLGETVSIKAVLTGKEYLHGWAIEIRKKADGSVLYEKSLHTHGQSLHIDEAWSNNVPGNADLVLEVFAQLDHDGTMTSTTVNLHSQP